MIDFRTFVRIMGALVIASAVVYAWDAHRVLTQSLSVPAEGATIQVETGQTLSGLALELERSGVLFGSKRLIWAARLSGRDLGIKAGEYEVLPRMRAVDLIDRMVAGKTLLHSLTIVEGWTFRQLRSAMARHPALDPVMGGRDDAALMAALDRTGQHPEGRFLPDTYLFERGTTDVEFLRRAAEAMDVHLGVAWDRRDGGLPYEDAYDALILASIVEKEARIPEERGRIAGVFVRRLQNRMRLQADPTVLYGLGPDHAGRIRSRHLRADTPYNTYTRHGLPPTPIALPGRGAIEAAMHPEPGDELYFVARGDGSHHFSATLEEHNRAVARYQLERGENGR